MLVQNIALALAVVAGFILVPAYLYDFYLWKIKKVQTISERIWDEYKLWRAGMGMFPIGGLLIVLGTAVIPVGLAVHFYW